MTEFVYIKGKSKWFRHNAPEEYMGRSSWKHVIYPDPESLEKIRELQADGLKNKLKKDEDGYHINFSRPTSIKLKDGRSSPLEPPVVMLKGGTKQYTGDVGNGSDIETKLEVYSHQVPGGGKAKAARWLATRVDTLVPFERGETTSEQRAVKGLTETEEERW